MCWFWKGVVYEKVGFVGGRDGIGSFWFCNEEGGMVDEEVLGKRGVIGEGWWWFKGEDGDK